VREISSNARGEYRTAERLALVRHRLASNPRCMDRSDEERAITEIVERLGKTFPQLPPAEIADTVSASRPEFADAPIRDFVPLFVERSAKHKLSHR
jgi:hypothetical protein